MFCVSENKLKDFIKKNWIFEKWRFIKYFKLKNIIKKMDKLVLNDIVFDVSESNGNLIFEASKDDKLISLLKLAISNFSDDSFNINTYLPDDFKIQ